MWGWRKRFALLRRVELFFLFFFHPPRVWRARTPRPFPDGLSRFQSVRVTRWKKKKRRGSNNEKENKKSS